MKYLVVLLLAILGTPVAAQFLGDSSCSDLSIESDATETNSLGLGIDNGSGDSSLEGRSYSSDSDGNSEDDPTISLSIPDYVVPDFEIWSSTSSLELGDTEVLEVSGKPVYRRVNDIADGVNGAELVVRCVLAGENPLFDGYSIVCRVLRIYNSENGYWADIAGVGRLSNFSKWTAEVRGFSRLTDDYIIQLHIVDPDGNAVEDGLFSEVPVSISTTSDRHTSINIDHSPTEEEITDAMTWNIEEEFSTELNKRQIISLVGFETPSVVSLQFDNRSQDLGAYAVSVFTRDADTLVCKDVTVYLGLEYIPSNWPGTLQTGMINQVFPVDPRNNAYLVFTRFSGDETTPMVLHGTGKAEEDDDESDWSELKKEIMGIIRDKAMHGHPKPYVPTEDEDKLEPIRTGAKMSGISPVYTWPGPEPEGNKPSDCRWRIEIVHNLWDGRPLIKHLPQVEKGSESDPNYSKKVPYRNKFHVDDGGYLTGLAYGGAAMAYGGFSWIDGEAKTERLHSKKSVDLKVDASGYYEGYVRITFTPLGDCIKKASANVVSGIRAGVVKDHSWKFDIGERAGQPDITVSAAAGCMRRITVSAPLSITCDHDIVAHAGLKLSNGIGVSLPLGASWSPTIDDDADKRALLNLRLDKRQVFTL